MKKLKTYLSTIVAIMILAVSTQVLAYGSQVDTKNAITMPASLSNGKGEVSATLTGDMSYQFVEITSEKYATIKKYETIYNLISAYIKGDSNYDSLVANYEKTYKQTANGIMTEYGIQFNEEGLNAIKGLWISELTTYNSSAWIKATGKTISLDLTTFEGTKYYIAWVQIADTYDAEVYTVTGTKTAETKNDDNKNEENKAEEVKNETKNETVKNETTKNEVVSNGNNATTAKKDTTTVSSSTLPKTGANSPIVALIVIALIASGVAYVKYRKIK